MESMPHLGLSRLRVKSGAVGTERSPLRFRNALKADAESEDCHLSWRANDRSPTYHFVGTPPGFAGV